MKITLLMVGKSNHPQLIKLEEEYRNRLKHYTTFDVQIVPELKNAKNLSEQEQKEKEADLLLKYFDFLRLFCTYAHVKIGIGFHFFKSSKLFGAKDIFTLSFLSLYHFLALFYWFPRRI